MGSITLGQYLQQLARHRNFLWFVGMDLVQVWEQCPFVGWLQMPHSRKPPSQKLGNQFWSCLRTAERLNGRNTSWVVRDLDSPCI